MDERIVALIPISGTDPEFSGGKMPHLHDKPLIEYTLHAARQATLIDRVIVSTDAEHIAQAARQYGAEAPFLRSQELANPIASVTEVLRHAVEWLQDNESYTVDWVVMLMITYPFRPKGFVDSFIQTTLSQDLDSSFVAVEERHAHWIMGPHDQPELATFGSSTPRAEKKALFRALSGYVSMAHRGVVLSGSLYGQKVGIIPTQEMWAAVNVHEPMGQQLAEILAPQFLLSNSN